jgi:hypothetical protein
MSSPNNLHRHVAAHAGDQFVESHLNRLGEFVVVAGHLLHAFSISRDQLGLGLFRVRPLLARLEMTKLSATLGGMGSVAISAVPILAKTF